VFEELRKDIGLEIGKVFDDESISLRCPMDSLSVIWVLEG